jgi:benzoyl-CoA reductase/2-hydroxyglutaryl-CoA dehydratase subunit BcrC/BadD/HgdB
MEVMQKVNEKIKVRPLELKRLKEKGKKVVACFAGDYIPPEVIHAAGAEPLTLIFGGAMDAVDASSHALFSYMCPFSRAQYGYYKLKHENPYYNFPDLLIIPTTCTQVLQVAMLYEYYTPVPVHKLGLPQPTDGDRSRRYFRESIKLLQKRIEGITGNTVDEKQLRASIALYRRIRGLLKKISELRKLPSPPITTSEFIRLNHAVHILSPEVVVELLEEAFQEFSKREVMEKKGPRILITGPNLALGDEKVLGIAEKSGALVVAEDFAEGVMFYWENVAENGDPLDALVDKYLMRRPNCGFTRGTTDRHFDFISDLVKDFSVDGIIWYQLRLCETHNIQAYFTEENFKKAVPPIPLLKVDSEYDVADTSQLTTRIETFIQTLQA